IEVSDLLKAKCKITVNNNPDKVFVADLLKPKHKIVAHNNQAEVSVTDLLKHKRVANKTSLTNLLKRKKMVNEASLLKPKHKKKADKTFPNKWCVYICSCNLCNGVKVDPILKRLIQKIKVCEVQAISNGPYNNINIAPFDNAIYNMLNEDARQNISSDLIKDLLIFKPRTTYFHTPKLLENIQVPDIYSNENADNSNNKSGSKDESISDNFSEDENWELDQDIVQNKELFKSPDIDNNKSFIINDLNDSLDTEIILWLFKFQQRYQVADVALESLIKFLQKILTYTDKLQFKDFSTSLYIAKKFLGIF
ncbi:9189_t:CDS:2, partial [Racocetra persica]